MAYDEGLAQVLREGLAGLPGISEKKMFGGICFMMNGNMVCGVHKGGAMFRVGKDNDAAAKQIDGVGEMLFTGKAMVGMVEADAGAADDEESRKALLEMSIAYASSLPPK